MNEELLDERAVLDYVRARGLFSADDGAEAEVLAGGVSNIVLAVRGARRQVVVKQALPQLRVAEEWLAKQERAVTEGHALALVAEWTPDAVPPVIDIDEQACTVTIGLAPPEWAPWKEELLAGEVRAGVAGRLGELLGTWHVESRRAEAQSPERFDRYRDAEAFDQLRVSPYHRTTASRRPEVAEHIARVVERMAARRECLVHGDFSPKNVLVGPSGEVWVLDFEVAHLGDPLFDVAFLLNHLCLKAVHLPRCADALRSAADEFLDAYRRAAASDPDEDELVGHLGCLLLARVDGKSPAEYLTPNEQRVVRARGIEVLTERPSLADALTRVMADGR